MCIYLLGSQLQHLRMSGPEASSWPAEAHLRMSGPKASSWPAEAHPTGVVGCIRLLEDKPWLWDPGSAGLGERTRRSKGLWSQEVFPEPCTYPRGLKGQAEQHRLVPEGE